MVTFGNLLLAPVDSASAVGRRATRATSNGLAACVFHTIAACYMYGCGWERCRAPNCPPTFTTT